MMGRYIQALSLFSGTIIGVGVFALPYVFSRPGFYWGALELGVLTLAILFVHLMYGDVTASLKSRHQLPGYAGHYLGGGWKRAALVSSLFSFFGSLVVYAILGSRFLQYLLGPFGVAFPGTGFAIFFAAGLVLFYYDRRTAAGVDSFLTLLLVGTMGVLIILGLQAGNNDFLSNANISEAFIPYGAILFALAGASIIPRVHESLEGGSVRGFRSVLIWGTLLPAALYIVFVFSILSASPAVTPDAISGLLPALGERAVWIGSLVGFLATITSFIGIGLALKSLLVEDVRIPKAGAWIATACIPFLLVMLGVSDFISLIGLIGAFAIGFEGLIIILLWRKLASPALLSPRYRRVVWVLFILFLLGILYEAVHFFG